MAVIHSNTCSSNDELRQMYRPADVRVLFVGESPPANGTFFYLADSNLWRYTNEAFRKVYGVDFGRDNDFREFFESKGCYVEDLCLYPVNRMEESERRHACDASVESLAKRLPLLPPQAVVCVKKSIVRQVKSAMAQAGLQGVPLYELPFPSCGHQRKYVEGLVTLIKKLRVSGVMV